MTELRLRRGECNPVDILVYRCWIMNVCTAKEFHTRTFERRFKRIDLFWLPNESFECRFFNIILTVLYRSGYLFLMFESILTDPVQRWQATIEPGSTVTLKFFGPTELSTDARVVGFTRHFFSTYPIRNYHNILLWFTPKSRIKEKLQELSYDPWVTFSFIPFFFLLRPKVLWFIRYKVMVDLYCLKNIWILRHQPKCCLI